MYCVGSGATDLRCPRRCSASRSGVDTKRAARRHLRNRSAGSGARYSLASNLCRCTGYDKVIRIVQSPGFSGKKQEVRHATGGVPGPRIDPLVDMGEWYGGSGIMHQKIWIFDARHVYLGSANMDWKSIAQVKEMGVAVEDCPELAADAGKYFETWWTFTALPPSSVEVFDPAARIDRRVPPWSALVPPAQRAPSPLAEDQFATVYNRKTPLPLDLAENAAACSSPAARTKFAVPGAPGTRKGWCTPSTTRGSVSVSVMDFAPIGLYSRQSAGAPLGDEGIIPNDTPVWWPAFSTRFFRRC